MDNKNYAYPFLLKKTGVITKLAGTKIITSINNTKDSKLEV
jgi:hypothetical protein